MPIAFYKRNNTYQEAAMKRMTAVIMICFVLAGCSTVPDKGRKLPKFYADEELQMKYNCITCVVEGKKSGSVRPCDDPGLEIILSVTGRSASYYEKYKNGRMLASSVGIMNTILVLGLAYYFAGEPGSWGFLTGTLGSLTGVPHSNGIQYALASGIPGTILSVYFSYDADQYLSGALKEYNKALGKSR